MKRAITLPALACSVTLLSSPSLAEETMDTDSMPEAASVMESVVMMESAPLVERGRYLVTVSGCNDCHTDGYAQSGGMVAENDRLLGSRVGFKGPWGTTYPSNLRLVAAGMDEEQWLQQARMERRPPMPWFNLRDASDEDLRAMYRYLRQLGPKGEEVPAYVPPDGKVETAFILFVPQQVTHQ